MNKIIIAFIAILSTAAFARSTHHTTTNYSESSYNSTRYGTAGCGLGSIVFKDQPGPIQIVAATLNGTSGNQTFGITSGTSNCNDGHNLIKAYIETNHDALKVAAARGQGEAIVGLAHVMNCSNASALSQALKANYKQVFDTNDVEQTLKNINQVIDSNSSLKTTCQA